MNRIKFTLGIGIFFILLGGIVSYITYNFNKDSKTKGMELLKAVDEKVLSTNTTPPKKPEIVKGAVASNSFNPPIGSAIGKLEIPKINLEVALVEGTEKEQVDSAVGHLNTSVLPGMIGCSILAGHNVTYFKHINDLKKNDEIKVETAYGNFTYKVTKSELVHVGDEIQNTAIPTIILETCYPFDARYLTDKRYLVYAEFTDSQLK